MKNKDLAEWKIRTWRLTILCVTVPLTLIFYFFAFNCLRRERCHSYSYSYLHIYIHMYIHTRTSSNTHTLTLSHAHTHTYTHACTHTHPPPPAHTHTQVLQYADPAIDASLSPVLVSCFLFRKKNVFQQASCKCCHLFLCFRERESAGMEGWCWG